jgi:hypothetical protein
MILERGTMKFVGAALRNIINNGSLIPAKLSRIVVGNYLKLLDRILV